MLDKVTAGHFESLLDKRIALQTSDAGTLHATVTKIIEHPKARCTNLGDDTRTPFSVTLTVDETTSFHQGLCSIETEELQELPQVMVVQVAPLGRDPSKSYFEIIFN